MNPDCSPRKPGNANAYLTSVQKLPVAILLSGCLLFAPNMHAQSEEDPWNNLHKITKKHTYAYADRKGGCGNGRITRVTDQSVTLKRPDNTQVTIRRAELLRIGQWGLWPIGTLFSGRSSWYDVKLLPHDAKDSNRRARIRIVTSDGEEHSGELLGADDSSLKVSKHGKEFSFAKSDISRVSVLEFRPMSDATEEAVGEMLVFGIFVPQVWISLIRIPVVLYDVSRPEENLPIECEEVGLNLRTTKQIY
jgi:hypothetical protein